MRLNIPTDEENAQFWSEHDRKQKFNQALRLTLVLCAKAALERLAVVLQGRSGQPYKVRSILYSLWNGKPTSLSETLNLDWDIKSDLCSVIHAFGYEDKEVKFFYQAIEHAIREAGQWDWFLEERFEIGLLKEYVQSAEREQNEK